MTAAATKRAHKVLIVEDEGLIALDLEQRLEGLGYSVAGVVSSGIDAVTSAANLRPDIILMDIRLAGEMDGIEAAHCIREAAAVPVVYVTSYTNDATVRRALGTDPVGLLVKPFNDRELHTVIAVALNRHAMEMRLREQRDWLDSILHSIGDAVIVTDWRGSIRLLNHEAERLTGWSEAQATGHPVTEVVHVTDPDSRQLVDPVGDVLRSTGTVNKGRFTLHGHDGTEVAIEDSLTAITEGGSIGGGVFVFRDITPRLRAERELQHARHMEAIGRLAGGIAHDFNNLLTVIVGASSAGLSKAGENEVLREQLATITRAAKSAGALTRQLLALGRRQVLAPKVLDVNELLREMAGLLRPLLNEGMELDIQTPATRPWVRADRNQLEQAIVNIVLNARDAIRGSGKVQLRTGNAKLSGDSGSDSDAVTIAITDNGVGIPPEVQARIFEPFFTTKGNSGGSGLGLATTYGIVTQSGGLIEVESAVGVGTTFTIRLPLYEGSDLTYSAATSVSAPVPQKAVRVLLAEDNAQVRRFEEDVLTAAGMTVWAASNGLDALALLQAAPDQYDVVVTDVVMPRMSGVTLARRALELRPGLRILFVSGYADDSVSLAEFPEGAAAFLEKPFMPEDLETAVLGLLGPYVPDGNVRIPRTRNPES